MKIKKKSIIVVSLLTLGAAVCIFLIAYYNIIYFYIDHSIEEPLLLEITLDGKTIFEGEAIPPKIMPPIVYHKILTLGGKHTIQFHDKTREIKEKETFSGSKIRTILIRTRKDVLRNRHIIIDSERIPIK